MVLVMLSFFVFAVTSPHPARLVHLVALRLDLSDNVQARVEESVHAVLEAAGFLPDRQRVWLVFVGATDLENLVAMPPVMHLTVS